MKPLVLADGIIVCSIGTEKIACSSYNKISAFSIFNKLYIASTYL